MFVRAWDGVGMYSPILSFSETGKMLVFRSRDEFIQGIDVNDPVMLDSGCRDKAENILFEEDIIKYPNPFDGGYYVGVVKRVSTMFTIEFVGKGCSQAWDRYEKVGNTYQNNDLLELL